MTLATYLDRAYAARFQIKRPGAEALEQPADVVAAFRTAAGADDALTTAARDEAARLAPIPDNRCVITRTHKAFLRDALAGETA